MVSDQYKFQAEQRDPWSFESSLQLLLLALATFAIGWMAQEEQLGRSAAQRESEWPQARASGMQTFLKDTVVPTETLRMFATPSD